MKSVLNSCLFVVSAICALGLIGCGGDSTPTSTDVTESDAHEPDQKPHDDDEDVPHSFDEVVAEVDQLRNSIRDAMEGEDQAKAHDPLHEIGDVLETLGGLIDKSELSEADKTAAKDASETLFDLFGKVDERFHDKEKGSSYAEVATKIDEAIAKLKTIKLPQSQP